ncbi:MAG TPA: hypothetical protein VID69_05045 [Actinomycetota bacterium]|jgi:hypothetical protein
MATRIDDEARIDGIDVRADGPSNDRTPRVAHDDLESQLPALVLVEWHDAWFDFDLPAAAERRGGYLVRTVGFLVAEDPRFLSLAQEVLPDGEGFRAVTHIPAAIVERVQRLSARS